MNNLTVSFNVSNIVLTATEDIPRCDLTIIEIRRTNSPSSYLTIREPYVDDHVPGCSYADFSNYIKYVDSDKKLQYLRTASMEIVDVSSLAKGTYNYLCALTTNLVNCHTQIDQTPTVIIRSMVTYQIFRFVGNHAAKEEFVRRVCQNFFSESKTVLDHHPFV